MGMCGRETESVFFHLCHLLLNNCSEVRQVKEINLPFFPDQLFSIHWFILRVWIHSLFKNKISHLQTVKVEVKIKYTDNVDIANYL